MCDKITTYFKTKRIKSDWHWNTVFRTKPLKVDEDMSEEKIYEQLDKKLEEIKAFETKLITCIQSEESAFQTNTQD
jgi:hypothetical protein